MRSKLLALLGVAGLSVCGGLLAPSAATAAPAPALPDTSVSAKTLNYYAALAPIAQNRVTASGGVWISLTGNSAKFTLQVAGVLGGAPHPAQLWVGSDGKCPGAGDAGTDGTISLSDETPVLGTVGAALTTSGDTSASSALAMARYPTQANYTYTRTFAVDDATAAAVRAGTAVLVVHGVDANKNGKYDGVMGTNAAAGLPAEATDPALCGSFVAAQVMQFVPTGSADTGGGSTADSTVPATEVTVGIVALLAAFGAAFVSLRRRASGQSADVVVTNDFRRLN
ncbi:hypothetical protein ABIB25_002694 [Nakamurella sp. UYEF19]|uniref:hypothetical protein n=1 Tax=Nakamurella sp. UYEF19 TaxID=1756392 RepID=UPI003394FD07